VDSFFLIDKPLHITSFDVIRVLRKKLAFKKMGHAGTLDPLATGLLLVATGNYTKLLHYIEKFDKVYEFSLMLDGTSDSFDCGTEIRYISKNEQEKAKEVITEEKIKNILEKHFL